MAEPVSEARLSADELRLLDAIKAEQINVQEMENTVFEGAAAAVDEGRARRHAGRILHRSPAGTR